MPNRPYFLQRSFNAMGSPCEIRLYGKTKSRTEHVANRAINDVFRLEAKFSRYRPDSLLSEINRIAQQGGSIEVDEETASLLDYAAACFKESDGLFDITSGILRRVWNFKSQYLPTPIHISAVLELVGWEKLEWSRPTLRFNQAGQEIDLGGAVKEYAADRVASLCWESGIESGLVNLGGDIKIIGPHPDGNPWRVGIQHPRNPNELIDEVRLLRGGLASSGDYQRCMVINGQRYGHILNPKTGWPVHHLASVSVIAEFSIVAGSACTIAMLKEESGPLWLEEHGISHLWVDIQGNTGGTPGF